MSSGRLPKYDLRLMGPSIPLSINWHEGQIRVEKLQADLQITAQKADVGVGGGKGELKITNLEGRVLVRDHKGELHVDSYLATVEIENLEGQLDLENFTGESKIQTVSGNVMLSSYRGSTRVAGVKGRMEFKNGVSPLHIENFEGELRGRSAQGPVFADVRGEADVRVETAEGQVNLRLPASGAWVNLGTAEGSLAVPGFLKLTRLQSQQIRTGRLRGSNGGSVFIRTGSGDIRIK